ncbi:MAG TPA: hypothetical protein PLY23_01860 [Alphaproteobacteria bacterium]|nr:hypothetical protein [Alphaproteobacteria bacterium]HQS93571.1 hypothetical protein [Alphaproteobacteria bacterium]
MSKHLDSILSSVPPATANSVIQPLPPQIQERVEEQTERIVAVVPKQVKEEIRRYIKNNHGATEKIVLLRALKGMGFNIKDEWLIDKRSIR